MRKRLGISDVVHLHDLNGGVHERSSQNVATNAPKPVDTDLYRHFSLREVCDDGINSNRAHAKALKTRLDPPPGPRDAGTQRVLFRTVVVAKCSGSGAARYLFGLCDWGDSKGMCGPPVESLGAAPAKEAGRSQ